MLPRLTEPTVNRYTREGIIRDVRSGKRILHITTHRNAHRDFQDIAAAGEPWTRTVRSNGHQRLEHASGGVIYFRSTYSHSSRGLAVDVVHIADHATGDNPDSLATLAACTYGSTCGEVMRIT